jgi:hypothetical protein
MLRKQPPPKRAGRATGTRTLNAELLDIRSANAEFFGAQSEKMLRARIARGTVPYRRLGGRIVFLRSELVAFFASLDGVTVDEAIVKAKKT